MINLSQDSRSLDRDFETDHFLTSAEVKNTWSCTSVLPLRYTFLMMMIMMLIMMMVMTTTTANTAIIFPWFLTLRALQVY